MDQDNWISYSKAKKLLVIGPRAWAKLLEAGALTVRHVPGSHPRVLRHEVEDLARQHTRARSAHPEPELAGAVL